MKTAAIIKIVAWSLVAIILTAMLVVTLQGGGIPGVNLGSFNIFNIGFSGLSGYVNSELYTPGGSALNAEDITSMEINWERGTVSVVPYDGDEIRFSEAEDGKLADKDKLHWYKSGDKLIIQFSSSGLRSLNSIGDKSLTVEVPKDKLFGEFSVDNVSSAASVSGVSARNLDVGSVSGSVNVFGATCSSLEIETVSGRLELSDSSADTLDIETTSGTVSFSGSFGNVDVETVSGTVTAVLDERLASFDADSVSGEITISLPEDAGFTAEMDSLSGSIKCGFECRYEGDRLIAGNGLTLIDMDSTSAGLIIMKK